MLAVAAAGLHDDGDPAWLQVVGGAGVGKTETLQALALLPSTFVLSAVGSPAALLSGTSAKQRGKEATGGVLRQLGDRGLLVLKDFTSVLSLDRDARAELLGRYGRSMTAAGCAPSEWTAGARSNGRGAAS